MLTMPDQKKEKKNCYKPEGEKNTTFYDSTAWQQPTKQQSNKNPKKLNKQSTKQSALNPRNISKINLSALSARLRVECSL